MPDLEWNDDATTPDDALVGGPSAESATAPPASRKSTSISADPMVRTLTMVALGLVVLYLVAVVSALLTGVLGDNLPKTAMENDLIKAEQMVAENPGDIEAWQSYANALIANGQYRKAQQVIDDATEVVDQGKSQGLLVTQARLYYATEDYEAAVATSDEVRDKIKAAYDAALEDPESIESTLGEPIHGNYWDVLVVKAESLAGLGDAEGAAAALDEFLEERPTAADVLIRRGDLRAELGDTAGAEADYREAMRYLRPPDDEPAREGLRKIGAE